MPDKNIIEHKEGIELIEGFDYSVIHFEGSGSGITLITAHTEKAKEVLHNSFCKFLNYLDNCIKAEALL